MSLQDYLIEKGDSLELVEFDASKFKADYEAWERNRAKSDRFSSDNPYYNMFDTVPVDELNAMRSQAIAWEANRQALLEQREYELPSRQLARQRAAGLNPDIQGGSSVSSGSSAQMAPGAAPALQTKTEKEQIAIARDQQALAERQAKWQNVLGTIGTVTNVATSAFGLFKGIKSLGSEMTVLDSQASMAEDAAEVSRRTVDDKVSMSASAASIAADQAAISSATVDDEIKGKRAGVSRQLLSLIPELSAAMSEEQLQDPDFVRSFLTELGVDNPDSMARLIGNYSSTPQFRKFVDDSVAAATESKARREHATFDYFSRIYENQYKANLIKSDTDYRITKFNEEFSTYFNTADVAQKQAQLGINELENRAEQVQLTSKMLKRAGQVYTANLDMISAEVDNVNEQIAAVDERMKTALHKDDLNAQRNALLVYRDNLLTLGNDQLYEFHNLRRDAVRRLFDSDYLLGNNDMVVPGDFVGSAAHFKFSSILFSEYRNSPELRSILQNGTDLNDLIGLFNAVK